MMSPKHLIPKFVYDQSATCAAEKVIVTVVNTLTHVSGGGSSRKRREATDEFVEKKK
jgi:hypothetical protein